MKKEIEFFSQMQIPRFNRDFYNDLERFTFIGDGEPGGKAKGLAFIKDKICSWFPNNQYMDIEINIPRLTVITTQYFDQFMELNDLYSLDLSELNLSKGELRAVTEYVGGNTVVTLGPDSSLTLEATILIF